MAFGQELEILIKAKADIDRATAQVSGQLDEIADSARAVRGPLLAMGAALAGIGAAGIKLAADFETSLAEVKTLLPDLDRGGMDELREGILEFSKELGITTKEAVPALYQAISAGCPP